MQFKIPFAAKIVMVMPNAVKTEIKFVQLVNLLMIGISTAVPIPSNETKRSHSMLRSSNAITFSFLKHWTSDTRRTKESM